MKILVCGGRHFNNYSVLELIINNVLAHDYVSNIEIVSGGCAGADKLGEKYAELNDIPVKVFPANWTKYGRAAGPIRNREMIDYIKQYTGSLVIAFLSKDTKGTQNTVALAKKAGIPVIEIPYDVNEDTYELFEGIRKSDDGTYELDWDVDKPDDLIKLNSCCVHLTKYRRNMRRYGYKVNKIPENKQDRNQFLSYLKQHDGDERVEMISRCIQDFYDKCPIKHFDYVIKVPSKSSINSDIISELYKYDKFNLININKKPVEELELDIDKIKTKINKDYINEFIQYLQKIVDYNKRIGNFSISTFKPQFRTFIKPMLEIDRNIEIVNDESSTLLIVDDIFTTGNTMNMLLDLLQDFEGTIVILTLLQNN